MPAGNFQNGALEFFGKSGALFGRGEAHLCIDGKSRHALAGIGRQFERTRKFGLQLGGKTKEIFCGKSVGDLRGVGREVAQKIGREDKTTRGRHIALFVEAASPATPSASQKACSSEFANVIVDGLPRQVHAASNASGGIGFEESAENLQA